MSMTEKRGSRARGLSFCDLQPEESSPTRVSRSSRLTSDTRHDFHKTSHPAISHPISPPPIKRSSRSAATNTKLDPGAANHGSWQVLPTRQSKTTATPYSSDGSVAQNALPSRSTSNVDEIEDCLTTFRSAIGEDHARLVSYVVESTEATELRVQRGQDLFSNINAQTIADKDANTGGAVKCGVKQHPKSRKDYREIWVRPTGIKTNKDRVPQYRFHHVDIKKSIRTPNIPMVFIPYLRDLESTTQEEDYQAWLKELEKNDLNSGFKPKSRDDKISQKMRSERARTVSLYLDTWLDRLAIPGCNKSKLMKHMARLEPDNAMTLRQKTNNAKIPDAEQASTLDIDGATSMFIEAFKRVFVEGQEEPKQIHLQDALLLDEPVDSIMDTKPTVRYTSAFPNANEFDVAEANLKHYFFFGCLICFSHSCVHGEFDVQNSKLPFSLIAQNDRHVPLRDILQRRRQLNPTSDTKRSDVPTPPCLRNCYRAGISCDANTNWQPLCTQEIVVLRSLFATVDHSKVKENPICLAAELLDRDCCAVSREFERLGVSLPDIHVRDMMRVDKLAWYDSHKKTLIGDWEKQTKSHQHEKRDLHEPCSHEGPCAPKVCTCVDAGVLCEKFCGCSVHSCVYKFTGCSCHAKGRNCLPRSQSKSPCTCVQLNRECDPALCGACGAFERADPSNAEDDELHATGCQNCTLQRGTGKSLLLGQSQLEGVGYGLFSAEDIAQSEFVVEYVGELIDQDEGVRREARRGDVFDQQSTASFLFTLLDHEGLWLDAAIYGNMSRYINHAQDGNMVPRIVYVNGEYRIKFTARRDIKAGEELFFNYGEEFPNLTKKLLDEMEGKKSERPRRKGNTVARHGVAGKTSKVATKKPHMAFDLGGEDIFGDQPAMRKNTRKRKRHVASDASDDNLQVRADVSEPGELVSGSKVSSLVHHPTDNESDSDTPLGRRDRTGITSSRGGRIPHSSAGSFKAVTDHPGDRQNDRHVKTHKVMEIADSDDDDVSQEVLVRPRRVPRSRRKQVDS